MPHLIPLARTLLCRALVGLALSLLVAIAPAAAEKRVALVIGNAAYRSVARLDTPKADAELMADTLRATGFALVGGRAQLDLDKAGFERALKDLADQLTGADVALLYYAGHGVQLGGASYLLPVDASPAKDTDVAAQAIDVAATLARLDAARTKLNLVILDASRPSPLGRGLRAVEGGLAELRPPARTLISSAARPGKLARDGSDGTSLYTAALARQMLRPGLDVFATFHEVDLAVGRATGGRQQIWVASSPIDGSFHFVPVAAVVPFPQAAPAPQASIVPRANTTPPANVTPPAATGPVFPDPAARGPGPSGLPTPGVAPPAPALPPVAGAPRAILYDEDPALAQGLRFAGTVSWRTEPDKAQNGLAVRATVDVPERGIRLSLLMRRNLDATLPASHVFEFSFDVRADVNGGGIDNVPGVLMKTAENTRGTPLAGLAVKVSGNFFMAGLSNVAADRARNLELLTTRDWFDIPMVYANKRRAILAIEKGEAGQRAIDEALAAWGDAPVPAAPPRVVRTEREPPAAAAAPDGGGFAVLVSSQRSEADALAAWRALQEKYPAVLASRQPQIRRADLGDKGVYFRATVGPFATSSEATQVCDDLKAAGGQCVVQWTPR